MSGPTDVRGTLSVAEAKQLVERTEHVTTDELAAVLSGRPTPHHVAHLRRRGALVGLRFARRGYLHPAFQLDLAAGRIHPVVVKANRLVLARLPLHDAIAWWLTPSIDGVPPSRLVVTDARAVLDAAVSAARRPEAGPAPLFCGTT